MSLYPSLEDMKVDQMSRAQMQLAGETAAATFAEAKASAPASAPVSTLPYPLTPQNPQPDLSHMYPALTEYMGIEFTQDVIAANMPEYLNTPQPTSANALVTPQPSSVLPYGMVAPISSSSLGIQKTNINHGIREVVLCKDTEGRVGLRVKTISQGVFVCLVKKGSPAALAGLRFGDQILQVNGTSVAGFSMDKVHDMFRRASINNINLAIRDRPFERSVTLHKDSTGHVGFHFKEGEVTALVKDSSAARNGLLTAHYLLEVNGQNVVGLKDKEVSTVISESGPVVTVTIMPAFIYKHMMKHMASSLVTKFMDHSVPDL